MNIDPLQAMNDALALLAAPSDQQLVAADNAPKRLEQVFEEARRAFVRRGPLPIESVDEALLDLRYELDRMLAEEDLWTIEALIAHERWRRLRARVRRAASTIAEAFKQ